MGKTLIEFQNVTKRFSNHAVLDRVNLEIYEGEVTTVIGKSGTGKSVLLKHIIGLLTPDEGTILYYGQPIQEMSKSEKNRLFSQISYMFQNNALFDSMSVFENVALPLRQTTNLNQKAIEEKAAREKKILQESIRSYEEQVNSYRKRIQQQEIEANARENKLKTISTLWTFDKKAVDVLSKAITIMSKSRDFLAHILAFSVPKERFIKILDHVSELENKKWTEVKKEIDAMRAYKVHSAALEKLSDLKIKV